MANKHFDCIILGAGPAGLSSALYAHRSGLKTAIVDISAIGGAPVNYCEIENYLGFGKIQGFELCEKFENHIDEFEIEKYPYQEIQNIDLLSPIKKIETLEYTFSADSVIIAVGAKSKKLNVKGEIENIGRGVSYCAVCDGAFYKDLTVAVAGGGNSALEEALYLTKHAKKVYLIHRRDAFRAEKIVQDRVLENKKIELVLNSTVEEIKSDNKVNSILIKNVKTNKISELKVNGIFPYIGLEPNVEQFGAQLKLDEFGFIVTDEYMRTNISGIYAVGDVRKTPLRQVITAVSDGAIAGVDAAKYVMNLKEAIRK